LTLYDLLDREVQTLVDGMKEPGVHFYRIQAGEFVESRKLIVLR
jgi:hypothetical protein